MDFSWSDEQRALWDDIATWADEELNDGILEADSDGSFDRTKWQRIADKGLLGAPLPKVYGGEDRDVLTSVLMLEALGYGCRDNGLTLAVNGQIWAVEQAILRYGSDEQKQRWLPGMCDGSLLGADAITEPEAGSDTQAMVTTAARRDDGYVLNGHKTMIGFAPICDLALVFAKTDPDRGPWGMSAFLVDTQTEGVERLGPRQKMGLRTSPLGDIVFHDAWVPETSMLGPEGAGSSIFAESMEWERGFIFTSHVGSMARQLDDAVAYAKDRRQFGQHIGQFQSVSNRIADMKTRLELSRLLLYRVAWLKATDQRAQLESAMANLYLSESFVTSSLDSIRTHGGRGYLSENEIERDLRDAVGGVIYSGTSDIQRQVISRLLGL